LKRRLLAVVAHPDDETFGMGGTLAHYSQAGVEVHLICATRGEAGEVDPAKMEGFKSVGELREHELCCAAKELGIHKVYFLNFRDSGMPNTPENLHPDALIQAQIDEVAGSITTHIRTIKPQVMITFDPAGGYMHPDHIFIHIATVRAFFLAGVHLTNDGNNLPFRPDKLFLHVFPRTFLKLIVKFFPLFGKDPRKFGKNGDIDLTAILSNNFPVHVNVNYKKEAGMRRKASVCHASQGGDQQSGYIITWLLRLISSNESFMQAYPVIGKTKLSKDFFDE